MRKRKWKRNASAQHTKCLSIPFPGGGRKSATDILQNYIRYTGQTEGALSMQFFWKPGRGIQVCEIAGRFFGYEHELTDMVYGFQTEELLLDYLYEKTG